MKACSKECREITNICDFCQYYEFRGKGFIKNGIIYRDAVYTGDGWCIKHQAQKEPNDSCKYFYCANLKPLKATKNWTSQKWLDDLLEKERSKLN